LERALAALRGIERLPRRILHRDVQEGEEGWQRRSKGCIQGNQLAGDLLTDLPRLVTLLNLKVELEEVTERKVGGGFPPGDRSALKYEPASGGRGPNKSIEGAGLPPPGPPHARHDLPVTHASPLQRLA